MTQAALVNRVPRLGVIFHNRDNAVVDDVTPERMCDLCPSLIGFKDGVGDIELMTNISLRDRRKGYKVSFVKAGMTAIGRSGGPVLTPLSDLTADELEALTQLVGDLR